VVVGFPQDEGVRRNHGRPGAAEAPGQIRHWLYRMTTSDCAADVHLAPGCLLDAGDVRTTDDLEDSQNVLAEVIAGILRSSAIPIVLGGGHETAYGHYLGYLVAHKPPGILNIDAHLDVRPFTPGHGHSGSPFRQALEHPSDPLPGNRYVCLGAQAQAVSREHFRFAREHGCVIHWCGTLRNQLLQHFEAERDRLQAYGCHIYVTIDADAVHSAEVPGVSAPNVSGLSGVEVVGCARSAGASPAVSSLDVVEINPRHDRDGQSARWGALLVWSFLMGIAARHAQLTPC